MTAGRYDRTDGTLIPPPEAPPVPPAGPRAEVFAHVERLSARLRDLYGLTLEVKFGGWPGSTGGTR